MFGRVSFLTNQEQLLGRIQHVSRQYSQALEVASSGKRVNGPADDPSSYGRILGARREIQDLEAYKTGVGKAVQEMNLADSVLGSAVDALSRARELAVQGASSTYSSEDRAMMAEEVAALREQVLMSANARFGDRYLFSGNKVTTPAYDSAGVYQGDSGNRVVISGEEQTLEVSLSGDQVFGVTGGIDVMATLADLETALRTDVVTGVQDSLSNLDRSIAQVNRSRGIYGARAAEANTLLTTYSDRLLSSKGAMSQEEDADAADAFTQVAQLQTAVQASLQVAASTSKLSLLDYI